jgi:crossover junction endodeoxyribonuclease RuvC
MGEDLMDSRSVIGIDPGHNGAICVIHPFRPGDASVFPIPVVKNGGKVQYDIQALRSDLNYGCKEAFIAFIERQQPLPPKMGGSLASYWRGAGQYLFEGLLCGLGIPYEVVPPQTWQKEFFAGLPKDLGKQRSVIVCKRLFPNVDLKRTPKCRKDDDGIADAILIAEWGRRHLGLSSNGEK